MQRAITCAALAVLVVASTLCSASSVHATIRYVPVPATTAPPSPLGPVSYAVIFEPGNETDVPADQHCWVPALALPFACGAGDALAHTATAVGVTPEQIKALAAKIGETSLAAASAAATRPALAGFVTRGSVWYVRGVDGTPSAHRAALDEKLAGAYEFVNALRTHGGLPAKRCPPLLVLASESERAAYLDTLSAHSGISPADIERVAQHIDAAVHAFTPLTIDAHIRACLDARQYAFRVATRDDIGLECALRSLDFAAALVSLVA